MRNIIVCLMAVLLSSTTVFAQKPDPVSINLDDYKHTQQYYLDHYGMDDSTKALINYYFKLRKATVVETATGLFIIGGGLILMANPNTYILAIGFAPIIFTGALLFIDGPIERLIYNKKKLLHLIADYQAGGHLPRRFTHRTGYKRELRIIKGIRPSIWNILFST